MDLLQVSNLRSITRLHKDWIERHGVTLIPESSSAITGRGKKDTFVFAVNGLLYNGLQIYANIHTSGQLWSIWVAGFDEPRARLIKPWKWFRGLLFEECQQAGYFRDGYISCEESDEDCCKIEIGMLRWNDRILVVRSSFIISSVTSLFICTSKVKKKCFNDQ